MPEWLVVSLVVLALALVTLGAAYVVDRRRRHSPPGVRVAGGGPAPPSVCRARRAGAPAAATTGDASFGRVECTAGTAAGQCFDIGADGIYIGRDGDLSDVVIEDERVSKRHVWIGPRAGRVAVVDQGSTNGTYLNAVDSEPVTEALLNNGDTVIVSDADVARFRFAKPPAAC